MIATHVAGARVALALLFLAAAGIRCRSGTLEKSPDSGATDTVTMAFDYAGAEAIIGAIERDSLSTVDVDSLLRIHGVRAMVDNVTRFIPHIGEPEFRRAIQSFARTKQRSDVDQYFHLDDAWRTREQMLSLIGRIRANEPAILRRILAELAPCKPRTGPLAITAYFVAGGVSTGFVPDDTSATVFYANLVRAEGDYEGVLANVAHETYHLMQKAAQRRVPGLAAIADSVESLPGPERLLATTLAEGTANYIVDPTRSTAAGPQMDEARARYRRNAAPARVRENFAVFDTVLAGLRDGSLAWDTAYLRGFTSAEDERFYFVGYEMAKAIERYYGRACIGRLFEQQPVEFFRQYVRLYREHSGIVGRFAPATEDFLGGRQKE